MDSAAVYVKIAVNQKSKIPPFDLSFDYQAEGHDRGRPAQLPSVQGKDNILVSKQIGPCSRTTGKGIDAAGPCEKFREIYRISRLLM